MPQECNVIVFKVDILVTFLGLKQVLLKIFFQID